MHFMIYLSLLLFNFRKCKHEKITPLSSGSYCPDCGLKIEINWHLIRCAKCQSKRRGLSGLDKVYPLDKYCSKCGEYHYFIDTVDKVEFFDISIAVWSRIECNNSFNSNSKTQVWIEEASNQTNLIPIYT